MSGEPMSLAPGSIVRTRGREWVVLPAGPDAALLQLKPLGGHESEAVGVLPELEPVEPARFAPPDPERPGDWTAGRLLREAARLSTRNAVGAIRCWSRIDLDPRPYQLVPLLLALRMDPVRLLIADDVGIGKTIEALLIARELWDRGEIRRLTVLAPPALVEQWAGEMEEKFHLEAVPVLAGTAARLERSHPEGTSLFDAYPITVVSMDYIKAERRRTEFLRSCPEFVIVDEAHGCAPGLGARQQRYRLLQELAADPDRHLLLVTATPHSGNENAFASLVGLLSERIMRQAAAGQDVGDLLARCFVQRRRPDIRRYLETDTAFPERLEREASYQFSASYRGLFEKALDWAMASVQDAERGSRLHRVRWWSALALLRALGSSPRAAEATMRTRAAAGEAADAAEADEIGARTVLDLEAMDAGESMDVVAGAVAQEEAPAAEPARAQGPRRRLLKLAQQAQAIQPSEDAKLQLALREVKTLLAEGFHPIVFCRFIETAAYVAEHLRKAVGQEAEVACVTGELDPEERRQRIDTLDLDKPRVLVATDCLSEGINLQERFTAVVHYDLAWNPTRHEQREGRVDRFGQRARQVRALTLYGADNAIDGIVLDVLIRKHKTIRSDLGVSIPVPMDSSDVLNAVLEGLDFRSVWKGAGEQLELDLGTAYLKRRNHLHQQWAASAERQKESRARFAQRAVKPEEVDRELRELRAAAGDLEAVRWFTAQAFQRLGAAVASENGTLRVDPSGMAAPLRDLFDLKGPLRCGFDDGAAASALRLTRSHPLVSALSAHVLETALDRASDREPVAARCGVVRTGAVARRTTVLLVRFRYDLARGRGPETAVDLAEEVGALALRDGAPEELLQGAEAEALFSAAPQGNTPPDLARESLRKSIPRLESWKSLLAEEATRRAAGHQESLRRVREAVRLRGPGTAVHPRGEPDILGLYVYLPAGGPR